MLSYPKNIRKKAIAYFRHSAEDKQENSVAIQRQHIHQFANDYNIEIIHEEADEGKSGLLANRPAFKRLFANWIENLEAPQFEYVLVYDVSRWGRFQNQDEAAYFTHICTNFGKKVIYVSLGFPNDDNPFFSGLGIMFERYMASEYSRQLSSKVFYGCVKVSEQGYSTGGTATYGMARLLLNSNREPIRILKLGEHKQIANERVVFAPKHDETTETVKEIFHLFVEKHYLLPDIVSYLNQKKILSANGNRWDKSKVIKILTNEIYIGTRIYNKTWGRLKQKSHKNPRSEWVVVPDAFEALIDKIIFEKAQARLYWILNSWREGINAIKRAKKQVRNNIFQWLKERNVQEFEASKIISELPIIFAIKLENKYLTQWCFLIPEKARKYDNALAISIIPKAKQGFDDFFMLPIKNFTNNNFLIFSKNGSQYYKWKIENDRIEESIKILINQFRNCNQKYKDDFKF